MAQEVEEELRRALAQKEAEAAELQAQLGKAASLGQELISQNEMLKTQLQSQNSTHSPDASQNVMLSGCGSRPPPGVLKHRLSVPVQRTSTEKSAASIDRHVVFEHTVSEKSKSTISEKSTRTRTRSRLGTWEEWMAEKSNLEEEHALLRRKYTRLESELFEQQQRVISQRSNSTRSRCNSAATSAALELATQEEREEECKDQERQEIEQRIHKEVQGQYQEHIDELQGKLKESVSMVEGLDVQLQRKTRALLAENARCEELLEEMSQQNMMAESTIKQHEQAKELEGRRKSHSVMTENIHNLSRRGSALSVSHSIFEEVNDGRDLDHLEQENEELLKSVQELRAQLDAAQAQLEGMSAAPPEDTPIKQPSQGGGDLAAGRVSSGMGPLTASQRADAELLLTRLERVRNGIEDGNIKLQKQQRLSGTGLNHADVFNRLEDPGGLLQYWESVKFLALTCLCCQANQRKVPDIPTR